MDAKVLTFGGVRAVKPLMGAWSLSVQYQKYNFLN